MGADNTFAGTSAGKYVGDALKAENDCDLQSVVTLDTKGAGATTEARVNGMIAGFEEACGTIPGRSSRASTSAARPTSR